MTTTPFFSIIVPVYNHACYIAAALDSLLAQDDASWEAIVVDDGSTDETPTIVDEYAARDSRFKVVHKANGGVASALNEGLARAMGVWVQWLSSDDLFEPDKLTINRRWIAKHPDARFFFSYFTLLRESTGERERRGLWGPIPDPEHQVLTLLYRNFVNGISICVERSAWLEVGGFDTSLRFGQDYEMWLRFLRCFQGVFIPEWTVVSRNHAAQGSEVFPEACYFDTAKAAIRFLNRYRFPELVPWTDLQDPVAATAAVGAALDIACEPSAFVYCLGIHSGLILRVLEWVWSEAVCDPGLRAGLREEVVRRIRDQAFEPGDGDWHDMWRELAAACASPQPCFAYQPIERLVLARQELARRHAGAGGLAAPLNEYLVRYEGLHVARPDPSSTGTERVLLVAAEPDRVLDRLAQDLKALGYRPLMLLSRGIDLDWCRCDGVAALRRSCADEQSLPWLGPIDLAVGWAGEEVPVWVDCTRMVRVGPGEAEPLSAILAELRPPEIDRCRPVVFLERVLSGGGAERVVRDLAGALDRRRYRPLVFTLFEGPDDPEFPSHVATFQILTIPEEPAPDLVARLTGAPVPVIDELSGLPNSSVDAVPTSVVVDHDVAVSDADPTPLRLGVRARVLREASGMYHRLLSYEQRERLELGQRLRAIRNALRDVVPTVRSLILRLVAEPETPLMQEAFAPPEPDPWARRTACFETLDRYWRQAECVSYALRHLSGNAVVITVMEEATVTAWLARQMAVFPVLASLHTVESIYLPLMHSQVKTRDTERWAFVNACRLAEKVTMPSAGCSQDLVDHFGVDPSRILTLPNPVACAKVRRLAFAPEPLADEWRRLPGLRLINVARLDEHKNQELLLDVCALLRAEGVPFSLWIIGEGLHRSNIEASIARLSLQADVRLLGQISNPYPIVAAADLFLLSSNFEAFALVLVEAMICGTPIVSADCLAGPREVLEDGRYGVLVPPNDAQAMANAIIALANDDARRAELTAAGLRRCADFDVSRIVAQWQQLIDEQPMSPSMTRGERRCRPESLSAEVE